MQNGHEPLLAAPIPLSAEDRAEGLRLERVVATAHDLLHVYQNDLNLFVAHLGALYGVPDGWQLRDWLKGFEPAQAEEAEPERANHTHGRHYH